MLDRTLLKKTLLLVLRPAAKFCLRHSVKLQDIQECLKAVLVDVATESLNEEGHLPSASRVSLMTGVHRKDVIRISAGDSDTDQGKGIITKILGQWNSNKKFITKSGQPKVLNTSGDKSEFSQLCNLVSKDVNPASILFELERIGAIEHAKGGIRLVHESYVPKGDVVAGFTILAKDSESLLETIEENVLNPTEVPQLHARTSYDNIRPDSLPEIKRWLLKNGHEFHARVREYLGSHDQDINPNPKFKGKGVKVSFSSFSNAERKKANK